MHYKKKNTVKVRLDLFFEEEMLQVLEAIAEFEGQSVSCVVERGILYGQGYEWEKARKKSYKKKNLCAKKNAKKHKGAKEARKGPAQGWFDF